MEIFKIFISLSTGQVQFGHLLFSCLGYQLGSSLWINENLSQNRLLADPIRLPQLSFIFFLFFLLSYLAFLHLDYRISSSSPQLSPSSFLFPFYTLFSLNLNVHNIAGNLVWFDFLHGAIYIFLRVSLLCGFCMNMKYRLNIL